MVVAIDGPAGVGKSTVARTVSEKYGYFNLNSGNFYRAATYLVLEAEEKGQKLNEEDILDLCGKASMEIREGRFYLNGVYVEEDLHTDRIDLAASRLSALTPLRDIITDKIRALSGNMDLVAEGRDMTSVVFPHAEVKLFLDASPLARAERRFKQGTSDMTLQQIAKEIEERDHIDRNKEKGSLKITDDAHYLDTTALTLEEVCAKVSGIIDKIVNCGRKS